MPIFQLMPGGQGMTFPDGRRVQADRRGRVRVDEATAATIRTSTAYRRYDALSELPAGRFFPRATDFTCGCGFTPWPWQTQCPHCGLRWERP